MPYPSSVSYRRLQFAAKTEEDKRKWAAIPARELTHVDDEQMLLLGLTENLLRADISPLDAALGLVKLRKLKPALSTAAKSAEVTGLQVNKVTRLLRLADSPEVVQKGDQEGIELPADAKNGADEEERTLDLMGALEFTRLYDALSKKGGKRSNGESRADKQVAGAIAHALKNNWGLREITRYVDRTIAELASPAPKKARGRPAEPFKKTDQELVIYYGRLEAITAAQRQSLLHALDELQRMKTKRPKNQR